MEEIFMRISIDVESNGNRPPDLTALFQRKEWNWLTYRLAPYKGGGGWWRCKLEFTMISYEVSRANKICRFSIRRANSELNKKFQFLRKPATIFVGSKWKRKSRRFLKTEQDSTLMMKYLGDGEPMARLGNNKKRSQSHLRTSRPRIMQLKRSRNLIMCDPSKNCSKKKKNVVFFNLFFFFR